MLFDTYALIEILRDNQAYAPFKAEPVQTTLLNVAELQYILLRDFGEAKTAQIMAALNLQIIDFDQEITFAAMRFRCKHAKMKLSTVDCISYATALASHIQFLTGDKAFEDFPNVIFVK